MVGRRGYEARNLSIWDYANATARYLDFSKLDFRFTDLKLIAFDQKPAYIDLTK